MKNKDVFLRKMLRKKKVFLTMTGNRLDENPFLFFTLRGIDLAKFIDIAIGNKVEMMLEHANEKSARIMDNAAIHDVFGL